MYGVVLVACALLACGSCASVSAEENATAVEQHNSSLTDIDLVTSRLLKTLATNAPSFSPILTFSALSYVGYVALSMAMPSTLMSAGLPLLEDINQARSMKYSADAMDILAAVLLKEVAGKSKIAGELMSFGRSVMDNGVSVIKSVSGAMNHQVDKIRDIVSTVLKAVRPECLVRTFCELGQMARENFPSVILLLRIIDSPELDEFSQALIEGTTIGDCTSVYYECDDL